MFNESLSRTIKFWTMIGIVIVILVIAGIIMLQYNIEGEKKLPYKLTKITIISTAEGIENTTNEGDDNAWNLNIYQINDIYISIDKTEYADQNQLLTGVRIENIKIVKQPNVGAIKTYMPNSLDGRIYNYVDEYLVENKLQYIGASKSNSRTLEVGNQGGLALISFVNTELGKFETTQENIEIKHDGTLIAKINELNNAQNTIKEQDLKFSVSFDLIIQIDNIEYKGTINLDLPCGNIIENGTATKEITDFSDVIFKRY